MSGQQAWFVPEMNKMQAEIEWLSAKNVRLRAEVARLRAALEGCPRIAENGCSKAVVDALRNHVRVFLAEQDK